MGENYANVDEEGYGSDSDGWGEDEFDASDDEDINNGFPNGNNQDAGSPQENYEVIDGSGTIPSMNQYKGGAQPPAPRPGIKAQNINNEKDRFHPPQNRNLPTPHVGASNRPPLNVGGNSRPPNVGASSHPTSNFGVSSRPTSNVSASSRQMPPMTQGQSSNANRPQKQFVNNARDTRIAQTQLPVNNRKSSSSDEDYEISEEEDPRDRKLSGTQFVQQLQRIQRKNTNDNANSNAPEPVSPDEVYEVTDATALPSDMKSNIPRNAMPCPPTVNNRAYPPQMQSSPLQNRNPLKTNIQSSNISNGHGTPFSTHHPKQMASDPRTIQNNFNIKQTSQPLNIPMSQHSRVPLNIPTVDQSLPPPPDELTEDDNFYEPIETPAVPEKSGPLIGDRGRPSSQPNNVIPNRRPSENSRPNIIPRNATGQVDVVASLTKHMQISNSSPRTSPHIQGRLPQPAPIVDDTNKRLPFSPPKGSQGSPGTQIKNIQGSPGTQRKNIQGSPGTQRKNIQGSPVTQHRGPMPAQKTDIAGGPAHKRPPFAPPNADVLQSRHNSIKKASEEQSHVEKRPLPLSTSQERFPVFSPKTVASPPSSNRVPMVPPIAKKVPAPTLPMKPTAKPLEMPAPLKITPSFLIQDNKEKDTSLVKNDMTKSGITNHLGSKCVAVQDHHAGGDCLSFRRGDVIFLTDTSSPYWWIGSFNGNTGRFPKNYVEVKKEDENEIEVGMCKDLDKQSWYSGQMDRKSAEYQLKMRNQNGCFYIRDTDKGDGYSMSLIHNGAITHLRVPFKNGGYFLGTGTDKFDTVFDLVNCYMQKELALKTGVKTILVD